ncbi:MAG: AmmeMemoRadiSam system radical SAM enzyme [Thiohalomonadales bacterium]
MSKNSMPENSMPKSSAKQYQLIETRLQEKLGGNIARCNLCLWHCKLGHGQRGFCQAHVNRNGTLYNLSYGILSALEVGAIEDKPVRHFRPGTQIMSVGSYGCNFRCGGCHNLEISWGVSALDELAKGESKAAYVEPAKLVEIAQQQGADGIAFTYSEPAVWMEYVIDVSKAAHAAGLYTVYVSNSFVSDVALDMMAPHIDVLCSDIKSMQDEFYQDICPVAKVDQVLACIKRAADLGIHVEVRTNIIPGRNDSEAEFLQIAEWIHDNLGADSPWHITKFFPAFHLSHVPATPTEVMLRAEGIARTVGLRNVYVYDDKGCDCAKQNLPVDSYINGDAAEIYATKKCVQDCCGTEGILLKKYESAPANPKE